MRSAKVIADDVVGTDIDAGAAQDAFAVLHLPTQDHRLDLKAHGACGCAGVTPCSVWYKKSMCWMPPACNVTRRTTVIHGTQTSHRVQLRLLFAFLFCTANRASVSPPAGHTHPQNRRPSTIAVRVIMANTIMLPDAVRSPAPMMMRYGDK